MSRAKREWSIGRERVSVPPFWELEDLLRTGLPLSGALDIMAARRSTPILVASVCSEPVAGRAFVFAGRRDMIH